MKKLNLNEFEALFGLQVPSITLWTRYNWLRQPIDDRFKIEVADGLWLGNMPTDGTLEFEYNGNDFRLQPIDIPVKDDFLDKLIAVDQYCPKYNKPISELNNYDIAAQLNDWLVEGLFTDLKMPAVGKGTKTYTIAGDPVDIQPQIVANPDFEDEGDGWNTIGDVDFTNNRALLNKGVWEKTGIYANLGKLYDVDQIFYIGINVSRYDGGDKIGSWVQLGLANPIINSFEIVSMGAVESPWYYYSTYTLNYESNTIFIGSLVEDGLFDISNLEIDNVVIYDVSAMKLAKLYSPMYDTTFDLMSNAQINNQIRNWQTTSGEKQVFLTTY